uniref:Uncharacterized protein LOC109505657 n=1 Tax=Elaeis guineensis var. tenera TaxID=51953 RepID=A0A6J0PFN4_ELAGV|nr:uncharacterized protein LOC109505657 [Elaeis guineensis]
MKRQLEEVPEDECTPELKDRIFVEVMGEDGHGRMRTWSSSMTKRCLYQQSNQAPSEETIRRIRDELRTEFDEKISYLETQLHQMRAQMVSGSFAHSPVGTPRSVPSSSGQVPDASSAHQTHASENERFTQVPDEVCDDILVVRILRTIIFNSFVVRCITRRKI